MEKLKGKVVLLDFWTYSCVNCIRTIPKLKEIWEKYKDKRFAMIGIHTPEFEFEKEIGNVKYAVKKNEITWPILSDPKRSNWENYGNNYWPRVAVIDSEGNIIFEHVGESGYEEIDKKISEELIKMREISSDSEIISEKKNKSSSYLSKETYIGKNRNKDIESGKVCSKNECDEYYDNRTYSSDKTYLHGDWMQEKEYAEYKGEEGKGWIARKYFASEVNLVLSGVGEAEVLIDDKLVNKNDAGKDLIFREGKSYVKVEGADMYNIVKHNSFFSRVLKVKPFEEMKVYSYTFG